MVIVVFIWGFWTGWDAGQSRIKKEAITAGVARYVVENSTKPDVTFTWITLLPSGK